MGIISVKDNKSGKANLLSCFKSGYGDDLIYWVVIASLLAATAITVILRLWLVSFLLIIIGLIITAYTYFRIKRTINNARAEINDLQKLIEKKESYISDFSHRIRTPLNNLPLINDLLSELNVHDKQKELLETLISSTNNMISALNELSMKSAGEVSIKPRKNIRFDLRKTIDNTVELLEIEKRGNILFDISWDNKIKKEYAGDPIVIKQIFIDIFGLWTSLPESEQPDVNIFINSKSQSEKTDDIEFIVEIESSPADKYITLNQELIDKSLSGKIINLMGGQYSCTKQDDKTVFSFTLPLDNVIEENTVTAVGEKIRKLDTVIRKKKKLSDARVLLVEDNITNQKIVTISLGSKVKSIDTAISGKEALDMFGTSNYDIILMDIKLPVMDGITVSKKIREIEASTSKHTPIIAITANAMIGDKEKCLSAGMDDYLSKPFQPQKLLDIISNYVTGSENP
ncbi:MAG: response regulator [Bacteroidota bacterium]|nr:response regulator [Bacteroidota bacterium]